MEEMRRQQIERIEGNRNKILNQPWSCEQLNFVRATDDFIELYCPRYQTLHRLSAIGASRTIFRPMAPGASFQFRDSTETQLKRTSGKWHFGTDQSAWLSQIRDRWPVFPRIGRRERKGTESLEQIVAAVKRNVVQVQAVTESGDKRTGSGFILDSGGKVVTNYHVVQGAMEVRVAFPSRNAEAPPQRVVGILHANPDEDLIVLQVHMPKRHHYPGLSIAGSIPPDGTTVAAVSMAVGIDRVSGTGVISATRTGEELEEAVGVHGRFGSWIQTTTPFSPGADGSPLFDQSGAVIGVMTFALRDGQNLNFAVSTASLRDVKFPSSLFQIKTIRPANLPVRVRAYDP